MRQPYEKVWSYHNLRLGIGRGHFTFTVTILFALNRLFIRDLFLENWGTYDFLKNEFLLRFSGIIVLLLMTLLVALFIHLWLFIYRTYQNIHLSLLTGYDHLFGKYSTRMYNIIWPMKVLILLGKICYYTIKYPKLKYSLYLTGFVFVMLYCSTGFSGYFLVSWLMSCCQKYCKYMILLKYPKGVLTLTEKEYWRMII
jgi:hypothetical protein